MSAREAAAALGVSERTIRRAIQRGDLAAIRHGSSYQIAVADLRRYAEKENLSALPERRSASVLVALPAPDLGMAPLPEPLSRFIGRREEIAAVGGLLRDPEVRLLTLTGPGGAGKTRLSIEVARGIRGSFPDGVVFVDLAAFTQPGLVLPAIVRALGQRGMSNREPRERVQAFLQAKQLLLVLDNFEQVLAAAPVVAGLVADARDLKVLVTSRAPLRVGGEREYPVPPLGLVVEGAVSPAAALLASDAGRLFCERARAHDPQFAVDDAGAATIADICARLDGLPLAIELAAARMKALTPRALLARLDRWLPLLTEGDRDAPARLRTMRNAIAWSYVLLDRPVQAVFRRLAVFAGGFTLDGAEYVSRESGDGRRELTGSDRLAPDSVLDAVSTLVEQSLVMRTVDAEGLPWFRMLETVREFGLEELTGQGEEAETRSAHARYFLDLAERRDQAGVPGNHERLQALLDTQRADFLAALTWLDTAGPLDAFFRLLMTFENSWVATGLSDEGSRWLERALAKSDEMSSADRAMVLVAMGRLAVYRGRTSEAERLVTEAVALLRREGDRIRLAMALIWLGVLAMQTGDYERAETPLDEARTMCEGAGDPRSAAWVAADAMANLGVAARGRGELDLAEARIDAALRLYRDHGLEHSVTRAFLDLGDIARDRGDLALAVERFRTSLTRLGAQLDLLIAANALDGIASAAATWNQAETAARLFGAADALRDRAGATITFPVERADYRRHVEAIRARLGEDGFAVAWAEGRSQPWDRVVATVAEVTPPVAAEPASPAAGNRFGLTRREAEVLRLLVERQTDREIASALHVSPRTVEWHVGSILTKLGVESRREAVALAVGDRPV